MCGVQQAATHQHREVSIHQHITVVIKVVVVSSHHDVLLHLHDSGRREDIKHEGLSGSGGFERFLVPKVNRE
jgi:hypothetical protein